MIDELYGRYENDSDVGIAYIYCNFQRHNEQDAGRELSKTVGPGATDYAKQRERIIRYTYVHGNKTINKGNFKSRAFTPIFHAFSVLSTL